MGSYKIAVPTDEGGGLDAVVSDVFGRAKAFTILDVEGKEIRKVEVIQNPARSYEQGAGPIVFKTLADLGVNAVIAIELGPGISTLLDHFKIDKHEVELGTRVNEAITLFFGRVD